MSTLNFNPQIFTVTTNCGLNQKAWNLLTLEGESPRDTVYFMPKGDSPSFDESDQICELIESEQWQWSGYIKGSELIHKYDIDLTIFDCTGGAYDNIVAELAALQENF